MNETSKSIFGKLRDSRYATRYFIGDGIDIGAGPDPIIQYGEFFPLMRSCRVWDMPDGDAELMDGVADSFFDFVHSSHCLEHMRNPSVAINNWLRILKPGGHMVILVPDEDLYEQGEFPSTFNSDHKHTFTIYKEKSWSKNSINIFDLLSNVAYPIEIKKIELLDATFRYKFNKLINQKRFDQTITPVGECAVEIVLRKTRV
jgi:SAM-dependent methyltransferase